eukprot:4156165-Amphidinium_carterae.1
MMRRLCGQMLTTLFVTAISNGEYGGATAVLLQVGQCQRFNRHGQVMRAGASASSCALRQSWLPLRLEYGAIL